PWGLETVGRGVGVELATQDWVYEYNGSSGGGDAIFPGNESGDHRYEHILILPKADGNTSGNICTLNGITNPDMHVEIVHNTYMGDNGGCVINEGGASPTGVIRELKSNLVYNGPGTVGLRHIASVS